MGVRHDPGRQAGPTSCCRASIAAQNVAEDVTYSGTVAGAMEATLLGIPAIALSQAYGRGERQALPGPAPSRMAPGIIRKVIAEGFPRTCWSTSTSPIASPTRSRVRRGTQGRRDAGPVPHRGAGGRTQQSVFLDRLLATPFEPSNGTDLAALAARKIAVTPLRVDLTDEPTLTRFAQLFAAR